MKRLVLLGICCLALGGCSLLQKINWNEQALASAAGKAVTAASITDEQIIALCKQILKRVQQALRFFLIMAIGLPCSISIR